MGTRQLTFEPGRADISPPWSMIYRVLAANAMHAELTICVQQNVLQAQPRVAHTRRRRRNP
jgi:hypothetical protein